MRSIAGRAASRIQVLPTGCWRPQQHWSCSWVLPAGVLPRPPAEAMGPSDLECADLWPHGHRQAVDRPELGFCICSQVALGVFLWDSARLSWQSPWPVSDRSCPLSWFLGILSLCGTDTGAVCFARRRGTGSVRGVGVLPTTEAGQPCTRRAFRTQHRGRPTAWFGAVLEMIRSYCIFVCLF